MRAIRCGRRTTSGREPRERARLRPARAVRRLLRGSVSGLSPASPVGPRPPLSGRLVLSHPLRRRRGRLPRPSPLLVRQARGVRAEVRRHAALRAPHHQRGVPRSARPHAHPPAVRARVHAEGAGRAAAARRAAGRRAAGRRRPTACHPLPLGPSPGPRGRGWMASA